MGAAIPTREQHMSDNADDGAATAAQDGQTGQPDPNGAAPDTGDATDWQAKVTALEAEAEKWRTLARKHEGRAKENATAASRTKTVEEQLDELRSQLAQRDIADVERSARLALTQVRTRLAEAGIRGADASGLLELVNGTALLADGEPDEKAIDKLATSLTRIAGRASPDPDQGRKGGSGPPDMNTLIRRAAGVGT